MTSLAFLTSLTAYVVVVALVTLERLVELVVSRRNAAWSLAQGGVESGQRHFPVMVALHSAFLVAVLVEAFVRRPEVPVALAWSMLAVLVATQSLRAWCIRSLGRHWNTRVIVVPNQPPVRRGPYRLLSHPNYLAVVAEGVALPLLHAGWITAVTFTVLNAALLRVRLRVENAALASLPGRSLADA